MAESTRIGHYRSTLFKNSTQPAVNWLQLQFVNWSTVLLNQGTTVDLTSLLGWLKYILWSISLCVDHQPQNRSDLRSKVSRPVCRFRKNSTFHHLSFIMTSWPLSLLFSPSSVVEDSCGAVEDPVTPVVTAAVSLCYHLHQMIDMTLQPCSIHFQNVFQLWQRRCLTLTFCHFRLLESSASQHKTHSLFCNNILTTDMLTYDMVHHRVLMESVASPYGVKILSPM